MFTELGTITMMLVGGVLITDSLSTLFRKGKKDIGFSEVFSSLGIIDEEKEQYGRYLGMTQNNNYILLAFDLSPNITSEVFRKKQKEIAEKFGVDNIEVLSKKGYMYFKIRKEKPPIIDYKYDKTYPDFLIPIGFDDDFNVVLWDLDIDAHMLIGGATNSGKTVSMHGMIHYITKSNNYDLYLSDMKRGVDFNVYGQNNLSSIVAYANTVTQTQKLIALFDAESNERWDQMSRVKAGNYKDWKKKDPYNVPKRAILMIDEYPDLVPTKVGKNDTNYIDVLINLARKCRAVGMHILISAQYPEAKVTPTQLRNNFTGRMAFRTADAIASRVILNRPGCEKLGVGQCYARLKGKEVFTRTALVSEGNIQELLDHYSYPNLEDIIDAEWRESDNKETKLIEHTIDIEDIFTDDFLGGI